MYFVNFEFNLCIMVSSLKPFIILINENCPANIHCILLKTWFTLWKTKSWIFF